MPRAKIPPTIITRLIEQEKMLLDKTELTEELIDLIDDEFTEIGSSAKYYNKNDVLAWLTIRDQSERTADNFNARLLPPIDFANLYQLYQRKPW